MLHARQALGGIVILVVDVDIVVAHGLTHGRREKVVVDKRFGGLAGEFHHHARRRVRVHVGVLAGHVIVLGLDNLEEDVAGLCAARYAALVAIGDVTLGHILARRLHQLDLDLVLNLLDSHALLAGHADAVGDALDESLVFAHLGGEHCLADGRLDFLFVISGHASVSLYDCLYHLGLVMRCILVYSVLIGAFGKADAKLQLIFQSTNNNAK